VTASKAMILAVRLNTHKIYIFNSWRKNAITVCKRPAENLFLKMAENIEFKMLYNKGL
jgi:hypothetical protein